MYYLLYALLVKIVDEFHPRFKYQMYANRVQLPAYSSCVVIVTHLLRTQIVRECKFLVSAHLRYLLI